MTRQYRNLRAVLACSAALALTAAGMITAMTMMHGLQFFVFRSQGTGATSDDALTEAQGPGQPREPPVLLTATAPDGTQLRIRMPAGDAWAGIAQEHGGRWVFLDAGPAYAPVLAAAARVWTQFRQLFQSAWLVTPLSR